MSKAKEVRVYDLGVKAQRVAEAHADLRGAFDDERAVEATILEAAIQAVSPALPALSSRVCTGWEVLPDQRQVATYSDSVRGVRLHRAGMHKGDTRAVWLLTDGSLLVVRYQQSGDVVTGTMTGSSAREAVEVAELQDMLRSLELALDQQLKGNMGRRAALSEERTGKLRAILALLERP